MRLCPLFIRGLSPSIQRMPTCAASREEPDEAMKATRSASVMVDGGSSDSKDGVDAGDTVVPTILLLLWSTVLLLLLLLVA